MSRRPLAKDMTVLTIASDLSLEAFQAIPNYQLGFAFLNEDLTMPSYEGDLDQRHEKIGTVPTAGIYEADPRRPRFADGIKSIDWSPLAALEGVRCESID
jgi:hypothetical protein